MHAARSIFNALEEGFEGKIGFHGTSIPKLHNSRFDGQFIEGNFQVGFAPGRNQC